MAHTNGANGSHAGSTYSHANRFADIPDQIDIPVNEGRDDEAVEVDLNDLLDDPTELCTLLENENVAKNYWMSIAFAYAKQDQLDTAIEILLKGLASHRGGRSDDKLGFLGALCWAYLLKCRKAPRLLPANAEPGLQTKDYYIKSATSILNEAAKISLTYLPLSLARGVLSLLRASTVITGRPSPETYKNYERERNEGLRTALKSFDDALKLSKQKNVLAILGKARVLYALGRYPDALSGFQRVLESMPQLSDPDPRIGIGCCFWQLGHRDDAKVAWERALEINPSSKHANVLLGVYHLQDSSNYPPSDPKFLESYAKGMTVFTQKAFKLDGKLPLANSTFAGYFLIKESYPHVEKLAQQAIDYTDVNAVASDGWYMLARKEHQVGNYPKALQYYELSDATRGGIDKDKGFLPAKFGAAQIQVIQKQTEAAKFNLNNLVKQSKITEALTLLGTLNAESLFSQTITPANKKDIAEERKKTIAQLEVVRNSWKDPKKKASVDAGVLLNLARLYETESPEKALQCLAQVEQMEIDNIPIEDHPDIKDEKELRQKLREFIPPALLNNMGCFYYQAGNAAEAINLFTAGLASCDRISEREEPETNVDAMKTTISFNLGRSLELDKRLDEAEEVYRQLLSRHGSYADALARLAFIEYQRNPEAGAKEMKALFESEGDNVDVRVLYSWFLNRTKRRTTDFAADVEQRVTKRTLVDFVKQDTYLLTSMGNICLSIAREMRGEKEAERRSGTYKRAWEFFEAALKYDPYNAYAAQGMAILVAEAKRDYNLALKILTNVRETVRDAPVYMNLGHVFAELKQFDKAIEAYENALAKLDRVSEISVLTALGRAHYFKGRSTKNLKALQNALEVSRKVLALQPEQPHLRFNVAITQFQIAQLICSMPAQSRTLADVETAATDLEAATEEFFAISKLPHPPFPRADLEQRGNMSKTVSNQVTRALEDSRKLAAAAEEKRRANVALQEEEARKKQEALLKKEEEAKAQREKILAARQEMEERDRALAEAERTRREQERIRDEEQFTTDSQTGEKRKRVRAKKSGTGRRRTKKRDDDVVSDGHLSEGEGRSEDEAPTRKKKRRLERGRKSEKQNSKFKSSEMIVDSDEEAEAGGGDGALSASATPKADSDVPMSEEEDEDVAPVQARRKRVVSDDDEDEMDE